MQHDPESFDILLSDQTMPVLTGLQLVQGIREVKPDIPAIICTGYSDVLNQENQQLKLDGIIRKPFSIAEVSRALESALAA